MFELIVVAISSLACGWNSEAEIAAIISQKDE
jgi:hypothetical protein